MVNFAVTATRMAKLHPYHCLFATMKPCPMNIHLNRILNKTLAHVAAKYLKSTHVTICHRFGELHIQGKISLIQRKDKSRISEPFNSYLKMNEIWFT